MPADIFLSYTHIKLPEPHKFRECLERELRKKTGNMRLTIFQDSEGIRGGDNWEERLRSELAGARILLVLLSPTWLTSDWCRREYEIYRDFAPSGSRRPVVPIAWDPVDENDLSFEQLALYRELKDLQMIEWGNLQYVPTSSQRFKVAMSDLALEIKPKLSRPSA